jgi:hypothetical protein
MKYRYVCYAYAKKGEITKEFTHYRAKIRIFDPFEAALFGGFSLCRRLADNLVPAK